MAENKVYNWITERIIKQLEKGTIPWRCPWITGGVNMNLVHKNPYRGINIWLTLFGGFSSPYWVTFNQVRKLKGRIRKGEKSTMIMRTVFSDKKDTVTGKIIYGRNGKALQDCYVQYHNVWNVEQTDDIDYPKVELIDHNPIEACDNIMAQFETCPPITHKGSRAFYRYSDDTITMPPIGHFTNTPEYYSTLFHETAHSTGHKSRLNRELNNSFGSSSYSFEELISEMTAAMLCGKAGIEMSTLENSAAYIAGWLKKFKNDTSMVIKASSQAQKAVDCITGYVWEGDKQASQSDAVAA